MQQSPDDVRAPADAAWLAGLLSDSRSIVARLLDEPPLTADALRQQLLAHVDHVRVTATADGARDRTIPYSITADLELAEALATAALALLERCVEPAALALAQVAIRYFVLADDGDGDLDSLFGFDDDVEVFNAIAEQLGASDLCIAG